MAASATISVLLADSDRDVCSLCAATGIRRLISEWEGRRRIARSKEGRVSVDGSVLLVALRNKELVPHTALGDRSGVEFTVHGKHMIWHMGF